MSSDIFLKAQGLSKTFPLPAQGLFQRDKPLLHAVSDVDLTLRAGETLALVGESGCGKTTLARMIGLLLAPSSGTIRFDGKGLGAFSNSALKALRRRIGIIFQDPYASLNPRMRVGTIINEPMLIHAIGDKQERRARVLELLKKVGLSGEDAERFPRAFSGGQRQRIAIARALAAGPDLLIADEPLSALDVSIQSQILNLLMDLRDEMGLAILFISHDLAVVETIAHRVAVLYLGRIVETASRDDLFNNPRHPYTRSLIAAIPDISRRKEDFARGEKLHVTGGDVASPLNPPAGCPYHPRCSLATELCRQTPPPLEPVAGDHGHLAACHLASEVQEEGVR
ncbi:MAG: ATP-binding cassette domain-containing protein [Rhodospirillaceae bacterium]|jgi:oligopeptide transport system ATP-binding protein|nr:ATP-binding cassette domain-containing protein [Rhodospirillaceae bacterium]MBT5659420.1 ATP-binding cassette domain-containing protein [Rhodospirillaceae bacterium]MBT5752205.1 ATP-binding cassette domain-containing protein [Rhodospirillaceae bacterium]